MEEQDEALSVPHREGSRRKQRATERWAYRTEKVDCNLMRGPHPSSSAVKPLELTSVSPSYFTLDLAVGLRHNRGHGAQRASCSGAA